MPGSSVCRVGHGWDADRSTALASLSADLERSVVDQVTAAIAIARKG